MLAALLSFVVSVGYYWFFTVKNGATPAKKFFGLRVIGSDGKEKVDPVKGFLREIVGKFISGIVLGLGFLWILWDKERQGWHDKIASTRVIQVTPLGGGKKALAYIICFVLPVIVIVGIILTLVAYIMILGTKPSGLYPYDM